MFGVGQVELDGYIVVGRFLGGSGRRWEAVSELVDMSSPALFTEVKPMRSPYGLIPFR